MYIFILWVKLVRVWKSSKFHLLHTEDTEMNKAGDRGGYFLYRWMPGNFENSFFSDSFES